ncbi:family 10 glycosylhydrolase [Neotamlana laminarinivorans]|uniref:Family 10 glycosylhydrolase n=1 Tax=Neotamlana laminarinivorans TaxID=2883124 RepID=A0A9X1HXD3_9FLAO|nr:family 10 glycosylhydrolase [Tamlana laminarinivorans]MCB4797903.1 family 10 glycosylhydrolase [Tamlana laminarinivorans]
MKLKIALFGLVLSIVSCNQATKETASEVPVATTTTEETTKTFKYWNWMSVGHKKSDSAYTAHFNKLKSKGIDAVLLNTGADPGLLKRLTPLATAAGLEVHAWMFTTNRPGDSIAQQHPDWYMVSRSGKSCFKKEERPYVGYYQWLSPSHPEARKHILSLIEGLAKVEGVASVHLDYIRYPDVYLPIGLLPKYDLKQEEELPDYDFDYSDASVNKFMALHHKDPRKMENPAIDIEWKNFRLNEIRSLVNEAYDIVHKHDKKLSAAVFPYPEMADHMVRQRWDKWNIDMVLPMIYYNFYNEELDWIGYATKQGVEDLQGKSTELHTGLYTPKLSNEDLKDAIQYAKDNGASGVAFFDDYHMTDEQFEIIKASKE